MYSFSGSVSLYNQLFAMTTRSCVDKCVCEDVNSCRYVRGVCEDTDNGHASGGRTAVPIVLTYW